MQINIDIPFSRSTVAVRCECGGVRCCKCNGFLMSLVKSGFQRDILPIVVEYIPKSDLLYYVYYMKHPGITHSDFMRVPLYTMDISGLLEYSRNIKFHGSDGYIIRTGNCGSSLVEYLPESYNEDYIVYKNGKVHHRRFIDSRCDNPHVPIEYKSYIGHPTP